ncbi:hypothetical protein CMO84_04055 [Candidatus Woesearchaeota archaeon]|jgi:CBS domain containing-hemolysin-like protein|nr:hypothetical protein [Candidatus Woesearchaeota archaeon]MDP6741183.1 CNNM domain-containing protein [Planctomycetota bacterium]MDP6939304.1 CNNM domain-containing protein [Planctomycetota bacterium]
MDVLLLVFALLLCLVTSFVFSGSETGIYTLSRIRVGMEADQGLRRARMVRMLLGDESALLITILIGNNLAIELTSLVGDRLLGAALGSTTLDPALRALVLTLILTPLLFMLVEALPKEIYRRRAHSMVYSTVPFILAARWILWPFERVLRLLTAFLEHFFGLGPGRVASGGRAERLTALLAEGRRHGALHERAEALARNALQLRTIPVSHAMVPWEEVQMVRRDLGDEDLYRQVSESRFTRLPVVDGSGRLEGYVHQLEVLSAGPESPVLSHLRRVSALPADTPVDRALLHLRGGGRRGAVVGTVEEPVGWVTLKDLVEEISGEVVGL